MIEARDIGDYLEFTGPFGDIFYGENKMLRHHSKTIKLKNKRLLCIVGGSGITPIYSILSKVHEKVKAELVYVNLTQKDILLHE